MMKIKIKELVCSIILLFCLQVNILSAQHKVILTDSITGIAGLTGTKTLLTPAYSQSTHAPGSASSLDLKPLNTKIKSAKLFVLFNLGDNYKLGNNAFSLKVNFSVTGKNAADVAIIPATANDLTINEKAPEAVYLLDFSNDMEVLRKLELTIISHTFTASNVTVIDQVITNEAKLKFYYEIEYLADVRTASSIPVPVPNNANPVFNSRMHTFDWSSTPHNFPNYEFELLRLHNVSESTDNEQDIITAKVDWNKALRIETQNPAKTLRVAVSEGTGYYIWRVRAIGNYYPGDIANFQNWGNWSSAPPTGTVLSLTKNMVNGTNTLCYFTDPDENINWIYSRTFTEGNRTSEKISYANGLTQLKQTQAYLPSAGTTIVSQSITDFSGRPALTTMPVPVTESALDRYKPGFVKKQGTDSVYTAWHFDTLANHTTIIDSSSTSAYSYYSDNNSNMSVPSANGYAFTRTLFYNDGTSRVKEQSGVGKIHSLGSQADGKGRTTRTFYGTPSNEELIRIFGDEAPVAESVFKTITVDANNTESVTYTSKEGKVIATCLVKNNGNNLDILASEAGGLPDFEIDNKITENVQGPNGFISTKRISFSSPTAVEIGYRMECENIPLCPLPSGDCQYKVQLFIHNVSENISYTSGEIILPACAGGYRTVGGVTWSGVQTDIPSLVLDTANNPVLPAANYIIEKRIYTSPGTQASTASDALQKVEQGIKPLIGKITGMLDAVTDEAGLVSFYTQITILGDSLASQNNDPGPYNISGLEDLAKAPVNSVTLFPAYAPAANPPTKPEYLNITAGCCNSMSIPIRYTPPTKCYTAAELKSIFDTTYTNATKGFILDFEGYAAARLGVSGTALENLFRGYNLAEHEFNFMIYHMLTDKYYTGKSKIVNGVRIKADGTPISPEDDEKEQYECRKLWNCWTNVVNQFENAQQLNSSGDNHNVAKGADESADENDPPADENTENTVNKENDKNAEDSPGLPKWLMEWITNKKLRKELRKDRSADPSQNAFTANLAKLFLECAGYQFAEILTPTGEPTYYSTDAALYDASKTVTVNPAGAVNEGKPTYPYIRDAKYAFKYFVYNEGGARSGEFPAYKELEYPVCYGTLPTDLCVKPDCYGRTHIDWSASERDNFYEEISGFIPVEQPVVPLADLAVCPDATTLNTQLTGKINDCKSYCEDRRSVFKAKVVQMYLENCYTIEGCAADNNVITENDINKIVDGIINDCMGQCDTIKIRVTQGYPFDGIEKSKITYSPLEVDYNDPAYPATAYPKCYSRTCKMFNFTSYQFDPVTYAEGLILPKCERERVDQVRSWNIVLQMPQADSKCESSKVPPEPEWWKNTSDPCDYQVPSSKYSKAHQVSVTNPPPPVVAP